MEKQKQLYFESGADDCPLRPQLEAPAQVVGTTNLYENGQLNYIPMPTPDPKGRSPSSGPQLKQQLETIRQLTTCVVRSAQLT